LLRTKVRAPAVGRSFVLTVGAIGVAMDAPGRLAWRVLFINRRI
jgi:hypothetical protein